MTTAQKPPVTVPCKYKTGKVLGNGTYATVKGNMKFKVCFMLNSTVSMLLIQKLCM